MSIYHLKYKPCLDGFNKLTNVMGKWGLADIQIALENKMTDAGIRPMAAVR